jgi:hypothetical protein
MSWIDDLGPGEFFKGMADAISGKSSALPMGGKGNLAGASPDDIKAFRDMIKQVKETTKTSKMLATAFEGGKVAIPDFTNEIKRYDEAIKKSKDERDRDVILQRKSALVREQVNGTLRASAVNLATGFAGAAYGLVTAGLDLTKGIIEGQSAISTATEAQIAVIKAQAKVGSTIGESMSGVGPILGMVGGRFKHLFTLLGMAFSVLGPFAKMASEKSAELAEKGLRILEAQLQQVRKGFYDLNASGVVFANGMTGMTRTASRAGLRVEDFAKVVAESTESLHAMGGGLSAATQRLAGVVGEIRKGELGVRLRKLGFDLKDQGVVAAEAAAMLNNSGRLRVMGDREVAEYTVKYAKDLKLLQDVAGKDAKKALDRAQKESMAADIRMKLMKEDPTGKALERFNQAFAATPELLQKGLLEKISLGTVVDIPTNVAMQANKGMGVFYDKMAEGIRSGGPDFQKQALKAREQLGQSAMEITEANRSIAQGARATGNSLLLGATEINSQIVGIGIQLKTGAVEAAAATVEAATVTKDKLTNAVIGLDDAANKIAVGLQSQLGPAITNFAERSRAALDTIAASLDAVNAALKKMDIDAAAKAKPEPGTSEKVSEAAVGVAGGIAGAALGRGFGMAIGALGGPIGMAVGSVVGGWLGAKAGAWLGKKADDDKPAASPSADAARKTQANTVLDTKAPGRQNMAQPGKTPVREVGFARGGITKSPAIFGEAGPEAAVPLPDGRTIPVTLKGGLDKEAIARANRMIGSAASVSPIDGIGRFFEQLATGRNFKAMAPTVDPTGMGAAAAQSLMPDALKKAFGDLVGQDKNKEISDLRTESKSSADDLRLLIMEQLNRQDSMIRYLKENVEVNKRILATAS